MLEPEIELPSASQSFTATLGGFLVEGWDRIVFSTGQRVRVEKDQHSSIMLVQPFTEKELADIAYTLVPRCKRLELREKTAEFGIEYKNEDGVFWLSVKISKADLTNPYTLSIEKQRTVG